MGVLTPSVTDGDADFSRPSALPGFSFGFFAFSDSEPGTRGVVRVLSVGVAVGVVNEGTGEGRSGVKSGAPGAVTAPATTPRERDASANGANLVHTSSLSHPAADD